MVEVLSDSFAALPVAELAAQYAAAAPFPHAVLDGVIDDSALRAAIAAFPEVDGPGWTHYLHVNERKHGATHLEDWPKPLRDLATALMSQEFIRFLEDLSGIDGLLADPSLDGGGLHRSEPGGFLNIHTDYTKHHTHPDWKRRVNVLLYLNDDWREEWGGHLELWTPDMTRCVERVQPRANRMVIFSTSDTSYHGHPVPLTCPPDQARKSLALYYFTAGSDEPARTTHYRARPEDGARRVLIYVDGKVLRLYDMIKRRTGVSDATVSRWLARLQRLRTRGTR